VNIKNITIDEFNRLAEERQTLNLRLNESNLDQYLNNQPHKSAQFEVDLQFDTLSTGDIRLTTHVIGTIAIECVRCSKYIDFIIDESVAEIVTSKDTLGQKASLCISDILSDHGKIDLLRLVEDTIYLLIPMHPRHEICL